MVSGRLFAMIIIEKMWNGKCEILQMGEMILCKNVDNRQRKLTLSVCCAVIDNKDREKKINHCFRIRAGDHAVKKGEINQFPDFIQTVSQAVAVN